MFIGGPGGTGKSRVLDALREFFKEQGQAHRFRLASFTGVAAKNIKGLTLHSALSLNKRKKRNDQGRSELVSMWRNVDYLFIDEVSMIGCNLMLEIHEALCEAKENTLPFGGINIIFAGDFAQLPPVGDTRLYSHLNTKTVGTGRGQRNVFGKLLWLSVDTVIMLHQIVRQNAQSDPKFTGLLSRLRCGECNDDDFNPLHSKLLSETHTDWNNPIWSSVPILVSNNDVKDALNEQATRAFAARTGKRLNYYHATDKRGGSAISDEDLQSALNTYHSGKTEQRMGLLPLVEGMPVMICQNYDVAHGIVNGCTGILQKIRYTVDEHGHRHAHSCVIRSESVDGPKLPHLNELEIVALEDEVTMTFTHPHSKKRCTIKRTQLPIMPAFAVTAHKSQGNTLCSAVLDIESCQSLEAAYVMLSRVKSSANIRILRPFKKTKIHTHLSQDLRTEFRRLDYLAGNIQEHPAPHHPTTVDLLNDHESELDRWQTHFEKMAAIQFQSAAEHATASRTNDDIEMQDASLVSSLKRAKSNVQRPTKRRRI